jgi:cytochrome c oxidase subunit 2
VKERTILAIVILALILVTIGYLVATSLDLSWLMPFQASSRAVLVDDLFRFMIAIAVVIFLIVEGALVFAVLRFRRRPGDDSDAAPVHGNNTLEIVWTLIPAVIVAVISVYSYQVLNEVERPGEDPIVVEIIGRQFFWEFRYPESGVTAQELHLPVNRTAIFQLTSGDVIHSFWVPEFRVKRDATPGQISELIITPSEIGRYPIRCAELCGPGHAAMVADAVVESPADFEAWLAAQVAGVASQPTPDVEGEPDLTPVVPEGGEVLTDLGRTLFTSLGCGACHLLEDAGTLGAAGPSLEGIGTLAGSRQPGLDAQAYLMQSILEPGAYVVEGYVAGLMPADYGDRVSASEIEALVAYLSAQE